jgi:hypothetical protein
MKPLSVFGGAVLLMAAACTSAWAQTAANVLVVVNSSSPQSVEIGAYYVEARKIPAGEASAAGHGFCVTFRVRSWHS